VAVVPMSYKAILDDIERKLADLGKSCAPNPFVPRGYCTLETAVDRAAAAYFPQEYGETEISPQERDRLARNLRAIEDLKPLDMWERDAERKRKHAENARRASAINVRSSGPSPSERWRKKTEEPQAQQAFTSDPPRPMSEDQEKAARLDAIEDDEVISARQRMERQEALKDAAWKRLH
jgi:hypothetical protein